MSQPKTREQFKTYCLRRLGFPVIEINVDDDQLEDRLDEALQYWTLYHYEGIEPIYMKQQIRASELYPTNGGTTFKIADKFLHQSGNKLIIFAFPFDMGQHD